MACFPCVWLDEEWICGSFNVQTDTCPLRILSHTHTNTDTQHIHTHTVFKECKQVKNRLQHGWLFSKQHIKTTINASHCFVIKHIWGLILWLSIIHMWCHTCGDIRSVASSSENPNSAIHWFWWWFYHYHVIQWNTQKGTTSEGFVHRHFAQTHRPTAVRHASHRERQPCMLWPETWHLGNLTRLQERPAANGSTQTMLTHECDRGIWAKFTAFSSPRPG